MKQLLRVGLSIGISFAILALLLQMLTAGVSDQDRPSIFSALQNSTLSLVVAYLLLYLVTLVIRAYRYQVLIQSSGEGSVPSLTQMGLVTGIRNMIVDMLPARIGELGYVALLNRGYGVKLQHCVSSLTISVAFDFIALVVVILMIVAAQLTGGSVEAWALGPLFMAVIVSAVAIAGLFIITPLFTRLIAQKFPDLNSSESWRGKAFRLLEDFTMSLMTVKTSGRLSLILGLSVVIRLLKYFGFYLLFIAVAIPSFPEIAALPKGHVVSALIGGEIGASMPIPTFMSFGAYEAGGALVFNLLGVADQAGAFITLLCTHIWSQIVEYFIGAILVILFVLMNKRAKSIGGSFVSSDEFDNSGSAKALAAKWGLFLGAGAMLGIGSMFLAYQLWAASKLGALTAPTVGGVAANVDEWRELSKQHVSALDGFVVFSSNRDGNHDIFRLDLKTYELDKLTSHPNTETYPRISSDGEKVIFSRAHQVWVSQRNTVAWDVYMLDLETLKETRLGENGTSPHWVSDSEITYLKGGTKVVKVNIDTLEASTVFEGGEDSKMPAGAQLQNPKMSSSTGQVVFTARQNQIGTNTGHWGTAIDTNGIHRGVLNGCELAWDWSGTKLYQVTPGGRNDGLRVVSVDPDTLQHGTLIDLEGEFSHEYWPKDSSNGEYMVLGASRGKQDHEHDTKDYEIFLWKVGSDPSKATRLTFHTGNDNWPDVYIQ